MQLLFIADLRHKRVREDRPDDKHGREVVTYLLMCNLALWITYNFEIQKVLNNFSTYISGIGIPVSSDPMHIFGHLFRLPPWLPPQQSMCRRNVIRSHSRRRQLLW